jgi:hypothetical protein
MNLNMLVLVLETLIATALLKTRRKTNFPLVAAKRKDKKKLCLKML